MKYPDHFFALVAYEQDQEVRCELQKRSIHDLPAGDVLIQVRYSSLNYKDALSATGNRGVTRHYPHTPGIDAAGVVIDSSDPRWQAGDEVICTGYDLGMNTDGGFGQYIRVPADWPIRKPDGLSLLDAMRLGTAGFTAGLSVFALRNNCIHPEKGSILVTGATGGVGSIAVMLLHKLGYRVTALTGKAHEHDFLYSLGAREILDRKTMLAGAEKKQLLPATWAGVVDTVGGTILATAIKACNYEAVVTSCGNAASADLPLNVYPFILRGVHLLGIYSAQCPRERRLAVWSLLAGSWRLEQLSGSTRIIPLNMLKTQIAAMLAGHSKGRYIVDLGVES